MTLLFLIFFEEASELATVRLFIGEKFDAEVLRDIVNSIAQANNLTDISQKLL